VPAKDPTQSDLQVILYCRKSGPGDKSVADQEAVGRRDVDRIGGIVIAVFSDNLSASRYRRVQERPGFIQTKDRIKAGNVDMLWTFANNRAHRTLDDYVELRRLCVDTGVLWRYGSRTYDLTLSSDRQATAADALRAEGQSDDISDATQRGIDSALEDNQAHGKLLRGYRIVRDPNTGKPIQREPVPEQAKLIQTAAEGILAGGTVAAGSTEFWTAWSELTGEKLPDKYDGRRTLIRMLTNPSYAGYRTSGGKIHGRGTWEPILTDDQLERLRRILKDPRRRTHRGSEPAHLLSYIAKCGVCDEVVAAKDPKRAAEPVYRCGGGHVSRQIAMVDTYVVELLMQLLERPDAAAALNARDERMELSIDAEAARIEQLEGELKVFVAEAAAQRLSATIVAQYVRGVEAQITEARAKMDSLIASADPVLVGAMGPDARVRWKKRSLIEKRDLVRRAISVRILRVGKGARGEIGVEVRPARAMA
jgi:DNA invertase Pin-like site-specific DNA recombinase